MPNLELILTGDDPRGAAADLAAALGPGLGLAARPLAPDVDLAVGLAADAHRAVDPVAAAALVLAIPSALLAALDLADRIGKRRRAQGLVETAVRIRRERRVEVLTVTVEGPRALAELDADALLALAEALAERGGE